LIPSRFPKATHKVTIVNVPENRLPQIERSYRLDGSNFSILATGEVKTKNESETLKNNLGNGARFIDSSKIMEESASTTNNKTTVSKGDLLNEVQGSTKDDGNNFAPMLNATSNPFAYYSQIARRKGSIIALVWENSNPALIVPGMCVRLLYMKDNEVVETFGVLLKAHHYVETKGVGMVSGTYSSRSMLSLFVSNT